MADKRFVLSPETELLEKKTLNKKIDVQDIGYDFFMKTRHGLITLSPVMYLVLSEFKSPNFPNEVVKKVLYEYSSDNLQEVSEKIKEFIGNMLKNKVLVGCSSEMTNTATLKTFEVGDYIEDFHIRKELYHSDKVQVFECSNNSDLNVKYILKIQKNKSEKNFFSREYEQIKKIGVHQNIRGVISHGVYNSLNYLILEYIEGKRIIDLLKDDISIETRVNLCYQILSVFAHIHSKGVLHGDIHMSNFLITKNYKLKLIDFGMSYDIDESDWTGHGGVPKYMPPERVNEHNIKFSDQKGDIKSEIYQIGLIMYLIVYDILPFSGSLWKELAYSIKYKNIEFPKKTRLGEIVPENVKLILNKSLSKNPMNRFSSVNEMITVFNKTQNK